MPIPLTLMLQALLGAATITAPSLPPSGNRVPDLAAIVETALAPWIQGDLTASPGGIVAIARDGEVVFERCFGMADLERNVPIASDTVFDIGSTSKQFTAAAVVALAIEEKLSLDDDIRDHVPELPDLGVKITIRHLLHHTSGVRDYLPLLDFDGHPDTDWTTARDALDALVEQKGLCFQPGSRHEYSNSGYFLLSQIAERVAGKSLAIFANERFFVPLGMKATHVHDDHTFLVKNRALAYEPRGDGEFALHLSDFEQTGDGAVMTTARDLLRWADNFRTGAVGGPDFLAAMDARGALDDGTVLAYGMGLFHDTMPDGAVRIISHGGAWAGYRAELLRIPNFESQSWAITVLMNRGDSDPSGVAHRIAQTLVGQASRPPLAAMMEDAVEIDDDAFSSLLGTYRSEANEEVVRLASEGGRLVLTGRGPRAPLFATTASAFRTASGKVALEFATPLGSAAAFTMADAAGRTRYVRFEPWRPNATELARYAGRYRSDEVRATIELRVEGDRLIVDFGRGQSGPLEPSAPGVLNIGGSALRFTLEDGRAPSFEMRLRGIAGLRFVRTANE